MRKALKGDGKCLTGYSFMLSAVVSLKIQILFRLMSFNENKSLKQHKLYRRQAWLFILSDLEQTRISNKNCVVRELVF